MRLPYRIFITFYGCRFSSGPCRMAKSKYEYVRQFEQETRCLPNCWIVVRVDGKGFHRFSDVHCFEKPNDVRGLGLMTRAAASVLEEFRDISLAFGHSDEYSFVFRKETAIYKRRNEKIVSLVASLFSSSYSFYWRDYFGDEKLRYPPAFDARVIIYPSEQNLRDYLSWRQVDVHVNNVYNTCFWALVQQKNYSPQQAEETLRGTLTNDKHDLLFLNFGINYNNLPQMFRKGTTLIRKLININDKLQHVVIPVYCDIISNTFWDENPEILASGKLAVISKKEDFQYFLMNERANLEKNLKCDAVTSA